jgi:membrane protease YdiL (CAAX protease family)
VTGPPIRQLSARQVLAVWAAATVPMAVAAWVIAPRLATTLGDQGLGKALILTLTAGLIWQFVLTAVLVAGEQHTLRWSVVRDALWLRAPQSPTTGRRGGKLWFVIVPLTVGFAAKELLPGLPHPGNRDLGTVLNSPGGQAWFQGAWGWFAIALLMFLFNTVLGEELLFRGYLLPRMTETFGRWAWLANGVAFAAYHVHVPWVIPATLGDAFVVAYPSQRYRSAWIGVIVHSVQSVFFAVAVLALVLR